MDQQEAFVAVVRKLAHREVVRIIGGFGTQG
jgi:hypothetical protein